MILLRVVPFSNVFGWYKKGVGFVGGTLEALESSTILR